MLFSCNNLYSYSIQASNSWIHLFNCSHGTIASYLNRPKKSVPPPILSPTSFIYSSITAPPLHYDVLKLFTKTLFLDIIKLINSILNDPPKMVHRSTV